MYMDLHKCLNLCMVLLFDCQHWYCHDCVDCQHSYGHDYVITKEVGISSTIGWFMFHLILMILARSGSPKLTMLAA